MIYYWPGADHPVPSGGVKTHYDHVRILNAAGVPASILHVQPGFRCTWFAHEVPIAYIPTAPIGPGDVLVMNEILGPETLTLAPGLGKVIFCQNVHYAWRNWPTPIPADWALPYRHPEVRGTMVLTDTEREFVAWVFPEHPVATVPHGIDPAKWPLGTAKRRQIAYMPRKHADEAQQVFGWLRARGALDGWDVVAIHGKTERETQEILADSLVFFAFGYPEGGTLPPFEAMASGCVVLGYGGFASDALMEACGAGLVPSGDTCGFARMADHVLRTATPALVAEGQTLAQRVQTVLPVTAERDALLKFWTRLGVA